MTLKQTIRRLPVLWKMLRKSKLDALEMLQADHMKVETLMLRARVTQDRQQFAQVLGQIEQELDLHARIEETTFYPACEKIEELRPMIAEAREEHKQIKTLVAELSELHSKNEKTSAKLKVLMEDVMHHVKEEENELFPEVRRNMSQARLEKLASQFNSRKSKKSAAVAA